MVAACSNNTPRPVKDWGLIVVKVDGHGLAASIQDEVDTLHQAGSSEKAWITMRAEQHGRITDFEVTPSTAPAGHLVQIGQSHPPTLDGASLRKFLVDTMRQYPAQHYFVALDGHSEMMRKAIAPIHDALAAARDEAGHKIDVLAFDSCFMAQVETASEFKDVAQYLVASEEAVEGARPVEEMAQQVAQHGMNARDMATWCVENSQELTYSAIDLAQVGGFNQRMKALGEAIVKVHDERSLAHMCDAIHGAQHFYTEGFGPPDTYHNTIDIHDAMSRMVTDPLLAERCPEVVKAAVDVRNAVQPGAGLVVAERHTDEKSRSLDLDVFDVRRAHGMSMHQPSTAPSSLRDNYTHWANSQFDRETNWEAVSAHLLDRHTVTHRAGSFVRDVGGKIIAVIGQAIEDVMEKIEG